jgi:hypothetical protein
MMLAIADVVESGDLRRPSGSWTGSAVEAAAMRAAAARLRSGKLAA